MTKADLLILGSGFGGSLSALIADRIGLQAVLVDRATHPRFAIGESSTPIADMILRDLSERYELPRLKPLAAWGTWQRAYPDVLGGRKRGFSYFRHTAGAPFEPDPNHGNELLVAASSSDERSDTQWYRADVDAFFAGEVRRAGVPFLEGVEAVPARDGERWRLEGIDVVADFIIDATGAGCALGGLAASLNTRHRTRTRAIYSHFTGVPRWQAAVASRGARVDDYPFDPDWSALHHVFDGGWMWMLRFANDLVSAGLVLDEGRHPPDLSVSPDEEWRRHLARYPSLRMLFEDARLAPSPGRLIGTARLQRRVALAAGSNWAMLPHTAGFVDPLHSTGIAHTLSGVERLMDTLSRSWGRPELADELNAYQRTVLRELDFVDRLVHACYLSLPSFERWTAAAMLYFAAATSYEHLRSVGKRRPFLLVDDDLFTIAEELAVRLRDPNERTGKWLEEALQPFNRVGLLHPPVPNMYAHTAAAK